MRGPAPTERPLAEISLYQSEYFTTSDSVFNFNFLAVVVSEIIRGSKIYISGPCAPWTPYSGKNTSKTSYYVFNFNFLALVVSEIIGGPAPPERPLEEKVLYPKRVLYHL